MPKMSLLGCEGYVPRRRIPRAAISAAVGWAQPSLKSLARGERAYAGWDEDAITLGVDAARPLLADAAPPERLCFASTTAPFLDRSNAGVIAAALDLSPETHCFDAAGSQRAATSALISLSAESAQRTLLVAGERRPVKAASAAEMTGADAGAAVLVGPGEGIAEILGARSVADDFVDHYRTPEQPTDYLLEERWFREAGLGRVVPASVGPLLEAEGVKPEAIDVVVAPVANAGLARAVVAACGARPAAQAPLLIDECGHAGAAHPLLMLAGALETAKAGALVLLLGIGQGCDAILLRATGAARTCGVKASLSRRTPNDNYARFLASAGRLDLEWGMRAERDNRTAQTVAHRKSRDLYGFVGGVCAACSTPQFPKSRRCVNPACRALDAQSDYRFAERLGRVKSFTEDFLAFTRDPPLVYGNVDFDGGGALFMEMTGFAEGEAAIGARVRMAFRIKDIDTVRGFHRYFWKAEPAGAGGAHG